MGLAKRLEEATREGRITEDQADRILATRERLWSERRQLYFALKEFQARIDKNPYNSAQKLRFRL